MGKSNRNVTIMYAGLVFQPAYFSVKRNLKNTDGKWRKA